MKPLQKAVVIPPDIDSIIAQSSEAFGRKITREEAAAVIDYESRKACWKNDVYTVLEQRPRER